MYWATAPKRNTDFSVRSGDGAKKDDPRTYKPGELVYIHVRSLKEGEKPRGLLLNARDRKGNMVGKWELPEDSESMFHTPAGACKEQTVMHNGATEKNYHHVFAFRTPAKGTGTIKFECLLKLGPANTGYFAWPNTKDLQLTESGTAHRPLWFKGAKGKTCTETCKKLGGSCDAARLKSLNSASAVENAVEKDYACKKPLLKMNKCSANTARPAERGSDQFCEYTTCAASCNAKSGALARLCPCSGVNQAMVEDLEAVDGPVDEDEWSEIAPEKAVEDVQALELPKKCESFTTRAACEGAGCYFEEEEGLNLCTKNKDPLS